VGPGVQEETGVREGGVSRIGVAKPPKDLVTVPADSHNGPPDLLRTVAVTAAFLAKVIARTLARGGR
jgi:hypothetical protein